MARTFMPKSGTMMPYIVLNRDAAVAGVFTVDGLAGSIDLTGKYLQITNAASTYAKLGDNSDITDLTALKGSLLLGADGTLDKHAITLKQLNTRFQELRNINNYVKVSTVAASLPTTPTASTAYGGEFISVVKVNDTDAFVSRMRSRVTSARKVLEIVLTDNTGTSSVTSPPVEIATDGSVALFGPLRFKTLNGTQEINLGFRSGSETEVLFNYTSGVKTFNFNNLALTGIGSLISGTITGSDIIGYGTLQARGNAPANTPANGTFLSSPSLRSYLWGRGGYGDANGAFFGFYHQENVGNYARGVVELNGYGVTRNWLFSNDGSLAGPGGLIQGAASDIRLKFDIKPAKEGAGERIDKLGVVEYTYADTGVTQRGFLSQQADTVDELYTAFGGENETAEGDKFEILNLIDRAVLADVVAALQEARATIKELTSRVTELENK